MCFIVFHLYSEKCHLFFMLLHLSLIIVSLLLPCSEVLEVCDYMSEQLSSL